MIMSLSAASEKPISGTGSLECISALPVLKSELMRNSFLHYFDFQKLH